MLDERDEAQESVAAPEPQEEATPQAAADPGPAVALETGPQQAADDFTRAFRPLTEGDIIKGTVVHIDREGVLVDVGTKSDGLIPPVELSREGAAAEDVVSIGDQIDVYVLDAEDQEGNLILSKKRADYEKAWYRIEEGFETGKMINAMVTDRVKGGLVVDLGVRGFVPASHVGSGKVRNLEKYIGQSLPLKIIEIDRDRKRVVLSHRLAVEEERKQQREQLFESLAEGQIREGIVRRVTDYGAFVDIGGVDGLLHVSEMSWTRINHPNEVVKVGDKIHVVVLKVNPAEGKISLGLRQILPDPWSEVDKRYHVGDIATGRVTRLVPFGAFVQLDNGIEGIIPNAELAHRRVNKPEEVLSTGDEVTVKVINVRPEERRISLSLRQMQVEEERREYREFQRGRGSSPADRTTIGDVVGDLAAKMRRTRRERRERERVDMEDLEAYDDLDDLDADEDLLADEASGDETALDESQDQPEEA
ncbi:MAG: 30S ribosomal protein S1 [Armatimonadetes bacterium]|nr:30S ribosomal protein S1 [Armatimonadota bacterium]